MPPDGGVAGTEPPEQVARAPISSGGGGSGGLRQPARRHVAWLWTWSLLLALHVAAARELPPNVSMAMAEQGGMSARRLQQACQPWPLSFRNECNGTAAVTVRAQLGSPLAPGSDTSCLNGASQTGEWCVRTIELSPGQQQVAIPQALNATVEYHAKVRLPSFGARQLGGNVTSQQTPWIDTTTGQFCGPPPYGNVSSLIACEPFRQVNVAQGAAACVDPADAPPLALQCNDLNTTCATRLLIANKCSLNINVVVYGVLATDVQPGFCVNNNTQAGEVCLTATYSYPAGTANTGDNYAFEGLFSTGLYLASAVPATELLWPGNEPDPDGVFVDYTTGERCAGPGNDTCLSFFQVPMDSSACGATTTHTFTCPNATCEILHCNAPFQSGGQCWCLECEDNYVLQRANTCLTATVALQQYPSCSAVPFETLNATVGSPSCASWITESFLLEPCPAACDFGELPAECIDSVARWILVLSRGVSPSNATLPVIVDSLLNACTAGTPVEVEAVAAVAREALSPYESCGPDAATAVATSPCNLVNLQTLTSTISPVTADCDQDCNALVKSIGLDCLADYFMGSAVSEGLVNPQDAPAVKNVLRNVLNSALTACDKQPAPAPSAAPPPPLPPAQPDVDSSSSTPVGAIVGGLLGAIAAVALLLALLWRRRRQQVQRASAAAKASEECELNPDDLASKATSSQHLSLASSGSAGMPDALASDPLISWIMASQLDSTSRRASGTSAPRSPDSSGLHNVRDWMLTWKSLQLQRVVGYGSFGKVYLASWGTIPVAVKVLLVPGTAGTNFASPEAAQEALALPPSALAQLEAEAGLLASLRHPCCVNFFGLTHNPPALVTEYCAKGSVAELLDKARTDPAAAAELTWRRQLAMLLDAAEGMVYLHSHSRSPIIHRDLKTPNLLVDSSWRTKVTDFGLSKAMEDTGLSSSVAVTNPRWLAPELMRGEHATQASDVFAFGVVMWELLTWERPWATTNPWQISSAVLKGRRLEIPAPAALPGQGASSPEAYAAYVRLMEQCWAQEPADRPAFPQVVDMLEALLAQEPKPAEPASRN